MRSVNAHLQCFASNEGKKETRDRDYTGTFLCELLIQPQNTVSVDLKYKEHIVSLSVNTSCKGARKKNPFYEYLS